MKNIGWFSGLLNEQPSSARVRRTAGAMAIALLLVPAGIAVAQGASPVVPTPEAKFTTPDGYTSHHSIDMGGRVERASSQFNKSMWSPLISRPVSSTRP